MQIKNGYLKTVINFLDDMKLRGRKSLGRTKLKEKLNEKHEAFAKDQQQIIDEYDAWIDTNKMEYRLIDPDAIEAMNELLDQEVEVIFNSPFRKDFVQAIADWLEDEEQAEDDQDKINGAHADAFALLYEELIQKEENDK